MTEESNKTVGQQSVRECGYLTRASRILLAEDDGEMRSLLARTLRQGGYHVLECADGLELMEYLVSFMEKQPSPCVDLVVSDVRMPWVSGLEVLRGTSEYLGYPPFVLITAFPDEETRVRATQLGAALMLSKPFEMDYFLEVVRAITPPVRRAFV